MSDAAKISEMARDLRANSSQPGFYHALAAQIVGERATQAAQIEALAEVLTEVMEWIKNWDPQFVQDDEWGETKGKVERALSNTRKK